MVFFLQYLNNSLGNKITFFHSIENCFVYCSISNFIEFNFLSSVVHSQKVLKRELNIDTMMTRKKQLQKRILTIVNSTIPDSQYSTSKALFTFFSSFSQNINNSTSIKYHNNPFLKMLNFWPFLGFLFPFYLKIIFFCCLWHHGIMIWMKNGLFSHIKCIKMGVQWTVKWTSYHRTYKTNVNTQKKPGR